MNLLPLHFPRWWRELSGAEVRGEFTVDMFAGGGGTSLGMEKALGRPVDIAINHDPEAIAIHKANHRKTYHFLTDIREIDPRKVLPKRPLGLLWLSPDCTHHSKAKGGTPVKRNRRALANVGLVWLAVRRPRVLVLENVEEFEDWGPLKGDRPDKTRKGQSFKRYVAKIRRMGYVVEWKRLVCADYGAPTTRRRLFLVARRDGLPIVWPAPTHAPAEKAEALGLKPHRGVVDFIDWTIPVKSIFARTKPLVDNTLRRLHAGVMKFVKNGKPFIVQLNHAGGFESRCQALDRPMKTLTGSREGQSLVVPMLSQYHGAKHEGESRCYSPEDPLPTLDTQNRYALVQHFLVKFKKGGTAMPVADPLPTATTRASTGLASVFMSKHFTGAKGNDVQLPLGSITAKDHHRLTAVWLAKYKGKNVGQDIRNPIQTLTGQGLHFAQVCAFLVKYNNLKSSDALDIQKPAPTLSTKDRLALALVNIGKTAYIIFDIGMRMLTPRELLGCQFGNYAKDYKLLGTIEDQVKAIGNSVPPEVAEAIIRANYSLNDNATLEEAA